MKNFMIDKTRIKYFVVIIVALLMPVVVHNQYYLRVINTILMYSMLTLGLNIILGFTGILQLGQAAMFALGAYGTALLTTRYGFGYIPAFIISMILPIIAALMLGFPSLRVRGRYLALVTYAFGAIVRIVANGWVGFTNGPMGISSIPEPNLFGIAIKGNIMFYYFALALLALIYSGCHLVVESHFGRAFLAIREDEVAASAMGINTGFYKILAFVLSAIPAGIAGSYYATYMTYIGPGSFTPDTSILIAEMAILGGRASLPGSILGSGLLVVALELLRPIAKFRQAFIGVTMLALLIFRPQGILGVRKVKGEKQVKANNDKPFMIDYSDTLLKDFTSTKNVLLKGIKVTKHFGGVKALQSMDFELHEGEILGLIGPNGSGKTTLFNLISGVIEPTSGSIIMDEKELAGLTMHKISELGQKRTFQNLRLFKNLPVITNVIIGGHLQYKSSLLQTFFRTKDFRRKERNARDEALRILDFIGLGDKAYHQVKNLPYGELKVLEIARAIASKPKILLLDEPAAGLNPNEAKTLVSVIKRIRDMGVTVFIVEHNMKLIMDLCDRIVVINFGEKIAEGTPSQIKLDKTVQEAYLGTNDEQGEKDA